MTTLFSSDFTQADGAPSGWSAAGANPLPQVVGNRLQSTSTSLTEMINPQAFGTTSDVQVDFDCKATLITGHGGVGVGLLSSTGNGGWYVLLSNSVHVYTYSGGVRQAARTNDDRSANGVDTQHVTWTYQASNNQVTVYLDGVQWSQTSLAGTTYGNYIYVYMEATDYPTYVEYLDNLVIKDVITGPPPSSSLDQEGFRWRNDDGSETTATWKAAQDTDLTALLSANVRLRTIVDGG